MARRHDQGGRPNFDMVLAAILSTDPGVSDGLPISGFSKLRAILVPIRGQVRAIASQWVDNAHSRRAEFPTLCARPGARNG